MSLHPEYIKHKTEYGIWRDTLNGGDSYIEKYLEQYSTREDAQDFKYRLAMTVNPAFASGAINDIKDAIFQRFTEVKRTGGGQSYNTAIDGLSGGVDNFGSTMNSFIGNKVLNELVGMGRVGIFVDMPKLEGNTLYDTKDARPYLYVYRCEDILNWDYDTNGNLRYVILNRNSYKRDNDGIITESKQEEITVFPNRIITPSGTVSNALGLVPFTILELNHGLLRDIAKYQIALMNISSSDINYLISANFPLYTEQINQNTEMNKFMKKETDVVDKEKIGVRHGRQYPIGSDRPGYIHPSPDPLLASIKKQDQLKEELRQIVALSVSTMRAKMESADSKKADLEGLESGLASIGTVLETGERNIASLWNRYEGSGGEVVIFYPERYEIKDLDKTIERCTKMLKMIPSIPVLDAQRALMDKITTLLLAHNIDEEQLSLIRAEIYKLDIVTVNQDILIADLEAGLISKKKVGTLKHYPEEEIALAEKEHADRLARIAKAQVEQVRGVPDTQTTNVSAEDKVNTAKRGDQKKEKLND